MIEANSRPGAAVQASIPFNDLRRQYEMFAAEIEAETLKVLRTGWWLNGAQVRDFAATFAAYVGATHCIPVSNGTDAIELALKASGIEAPNGEVITVANAGGYTTTAARSVGLVPVYADIEEARQVMSITSAISCVSERTGIVVATHLYGNTVDVLELRRRLNEIGRQDIVIIEDCAQAHGARVDNRIVGSIGDMSTFSFYPTKNLGAMGDAGAVVTSSDAFAAKVRSLQQYGWGSKYQIVDQGGRNSRMDEVQAAILRTILPSLDRLNAERADILSSYERAATNGVTLIERRPGAVVHLAVAMTDRRDDLRKFLAGRGIATDIHYPILDCDQPAWRDLPMRVSADNLAVSRRATGRILSVPCFVGMTGSEIDQVASALGEFSAS